MKPGSSTIRVGVIGYGYWGPNLVRNFFDLDGCWMAAVCDQQPQKLELIRKRYPTIRTFTDPLEMIRDPAIDAIAVATPVRSHFELALATLRAGKHVLVEKPLTTNAAEAEQLIEEAARRKLVLMVDHTFVYTSAVRWIRESIMKGRLGRLYYYDSVRVNLGLFQHDVNVLWDLAVHDIAIMDYILGQKPQAVAAVGVSSIPGQPESITYVTCFFKDNLIAHFHVNWLAPAKIRQTIIGGERRMVVYNDLESSEKIRVYDKGISVHKTPTVYEHLINYRIGNMWAPNLDSAEALRTEALHFLDCIKTGGTPVSDGHAGLRVVQILEAASLSMKSQGVQIKLPA